MMPKLRTDSDSDPDLDAGSQTHRTTRASVSFPSDVYQELERIAAAKKVSLAWVVRDAAEKYVADQWPLLEQPRGDRS